MAAPTRKYNPGFLSDDEIVASFCVRTNEFASLVEMLRECTGNANPHQLVIGPRGSGKTSLLRRVAAEISRDAALSARFFPVVFAEESYEVSTAGEFWLECLSRLAIQAPHREGSPDLHRTYDELRTIGDDQTLENRCLTALLDFADRESKRLVLMVENLNMMFRDMVDRNAGWRLRKVLQTESRIVLLASATSRFDQIDHPDQALYDQFRVLLLRPLDTQECAVLWKTVADQEARHETIRSLQILTGGDPRLVVIVARFGAGRSFRNLMANLLDLVDDHTEYFKGHIEQLPAQERRVYLALAELWKPATTKEIADRSRLKPSPCSAQLTRLVERGIVEVAGGTARRKQYYLTQRLYNIYYLLRRPRGPDRLVEALIRFMEAFYAPHELREIGIGMAREAGNFDGEMRMLHQTALLQLWALPAPAEHRDTLLTVIPSDLSEVLARDLVPPSRTEPERTGVKTTSHRADQRRRNANASAVRTARALIEKGGALRKLERSEEALAAYDEVVRRYGASKAPALREVVAMTLHRKGDLLWELEQIKDALAVYDEVVRRYGASKVPMLREAVAMALANKGAALHSLKRSEEALATYDEVVRRYGASEAPALREIVATAHANKGAALHSLKRSEEALATYDEVVRRYGASETAVLQEAVAMALYHKGALLWELGQLEKALATHNEMARRYGASEASVLQEVVATAFINKGAALHSLKRPEEALAAYDEVVRRYGASEAAVLQKAVAAALHRKGVLLWELERPEEALATCDEVVRRYGASETPALREAVATAFVNKGVTLRRLRRLGEALATYDEVVRRYGAGEAPVLREAAATAFVNKGVALRRLRRLEEALVAFDEAVRRFEEIPFPLDQELAEYALLGKASLELECRKYEAAIRTAGRVLEQKTGALESRARGHLIRARATLGNGDSSGCEQDIEALLGLLPEQDSWPREFLAALIEFSIELGPARMRELIQGSPASPLLLPLTTALEQELGLEPRVAREVDEVAQDIRKELENLRSAKRRESLKTEEEEG